MASRFPWQARVLLYLTAPESLRLRARLQVARYWRPQISLYWTRLAAAFLIPIAAFVFTVRGWTVDWIPNRNLTDTELVGLWTVTVTVFAVTTAIAALVINTSTDPLDRLRMIRRYRTKAFDFVGLFGLNVTFWFGMIIAVMTFDSHNQSTRPTEWLLVLLALLLIAVGYLLGYVHFLISMSPERKVRWLRDEMSRAFRTAVVSRLARSELESITGVIAGPGLSIQYDVAQDRNSPAQNGPQLSKGDDLFHLDRTGYLSDMCLSDFKAWLAQYQRQSGAIDGAVAAILGRRFRDDDAVAVIRGTASKQDWMDAQSKRLKAAMVLEAESPDAELEIALKGLRDKAWECAGQGRTGEFELQLEMLTNLAIHTYELVDKCSAFVDENELRNISPRAALRATMHELGEEVFRSQSPNIIAAWIHFPQRLLQNSRKYSTRRIWAMMYPWWRTAQVIQEQGANEQTVSLLSETITVRLHYYLSDLRAAWAYAPTTMKPALYEEAYGLRRVLARLFSAFDPARHSSLWRLWEDLPGKKTEGHLWLRCARHLLADYEDLGSVHLLDEKWSAVRDRFQGLDHLYTAFITMRRGRSADDEVREQRTYEWYTQLADLTWEEQMQVGLGFESSPLRDPARDLNLVMLLLTLGLVNKLAPITMSKATKNELLPFLDSMSSDLDNDSDEVNAILKFRNVAEPGPASAIKTSADLKAEIDAARHTILVAPVTLGRRRKSA